MNRMIGIVIALALMFVYSLLRIDLFVVGEFLPYIAVAIGWIYGSKYYEKGHKHNSILTSIMLVLMLLIMLCSYSCKSELGQHIKEIAFVVEVAMDILVLLMCFKLEHMNSGKSSEKTTKVDSYKIVDDLMRNNISMENKYKARATLMIMICTLLYATECFVLPLIMKVLKVDFQQLIVSYMVVNALLVLVILFKNMWFYSKSVVWGRKTLSESIVFSLGCAIDAYSNVYSAIISSDTHTILFVPYLIMAVGVIPFLNNSQKMFELYSVNSNKTEQCD